MSVSTRTPEGSPHRCPICGKSVTIEPSDPTGDAPCPNCGYLLRWIRRKLAEKLGVDPESVTSSKSFVNDLGGDSLDAAELVIEIEDEFGVTIPDEKIEQINTVADAIRFIQEQLGDGNDWVPIDS
jgi:acyl carrier protein